MKKHKISSDMFQQSNFLFKQKNKKEKDKPPSWSQEGD